MPRYEYKCKKCNKSFEVIHGINDTVDSCKFCEGEVRRVFHPVGIVFKGSGFYATDARNASNKSRMPQKKEAGQDEKAAEKPSKDSDEKKSKGPESKSKKPAEAAS